MQDPGFQSLFEDSPAAFGETFRCTAGAPFWSERFRRVLAAAWNR